MPAPTDILMFAPKELRGTVATLIGDVIEGPWNKNPVRQIDPIAQGMQDRGLPVPSGGRVVGKIVPKQAEKIDWSASRSKLTADQKLSRDDALLKTNFDVAAKLLGRELTDAERFKIVKQLQKLGHIGEPATKPPSATNVLKYDLVRKADREAAAKGVKTTVEKLSGGDKGNPSAKDSDKYNAAVLNQQIDKLTTIPGKDFAGFGQRPGKWGPQTPGWDRLTDFEKTQLLGRSLEIRKDLQQGKSPSAKDSAQTSFGGERKADDIMSRAPKDPRIPLKEKQSAEAKTLEALRKGTEDFDKKWSEWGKKNGIDPERARKAARAVWTEAAMTNAPHPTESQMKYLIALMMQKGQI